MSDPKEAPRVTDTSATTATAHLPGLDIEITHGRSPAGDAEFLSINMHAVPSFEAFGRFLETANPFAFWAQAAQMMWAPWLAVASAMSEGARLGAPLARISSRGHPIVPDQEPR